MDVTAVLLDILIVLVAAKVAVEIAERVNVPAVVAEIVAGMIIGPSVLSLVGSEQTLQVLGELGVILLLLGVGMEMDLGEPGAVGRAATSVAVGVVVPMLGGYAVATALGHGSTDRSERSQARRRGQDGADRRREHRRHAQAQALRSSRVTATR